MAVEVETQTGKLALSQIRLLAGVFAKRWEGTTQENANTQPFWTEFLALFGVDQKRTVLFEHHASRLSTGRHGRIDVFWPGELIVEQKSTGKDLGAAAAQGLDYLDDLDDKERPHTLVVSDFQNFEVYDLTSFPFQVTKFKLSQLPKRISLFTWMAGYTRRPAVALEEREVNKQAVAKMAQLYDAIAQEGFTDHQTSVFLTRILFLLFGEDTGLIDRGLFTQTIQDRSVKDGSDLGGLLEDLFQVLDREIRSDRTDELLLRFPYVNGSIFSEQLPMTHFDRAMRDALLSAADFEWGSISPAIFGSMFQSVKSKEDRRELGEHYTTERDIMKTLGPLFLDELKSELESARFSAARLDKLWSRIADLQILDPACGCGNFLVVAYRELRELELQIMERLQELTGGQQAVLDEGMGLRVSLTQFHGIEIEEWPARIAETALFIADHQANRRMIETVGVAPDRLPLKTGARIVRSNALSLNWKDVVEPSPNVLIVGNPPFNGARTVAKEQRADMELVWGKLINGNFDFVTAWYKKTIDYFGGISGRWAFVSTNSVFQGEPVADLWRPILAAGWRCRFAHRSFQWSSEASGKAAVHVSIVGFDKLTTPKPVLWTYPENARGEGDQSVVSNINPYLADGPNLLVQAVREPLNSSLPVAVFGHRPIDGGGLIVEPEELSEIQQDPVAAQYLRKFLGATELLNNKPRWCLWLRDAAPADLRKSPMLKERLEAVRRFRSESKNPATSRSAATPHLFGIYASEQKFDPSVSFLAIPSVVSQARPYFTARHCEPDTVSSNLNYIANDPDGFLLGVLSSSMFITWMRAVGGRLKSDLRFTNTYSYNTFPLPLVSDVRHREIVEAAKLITEARERHPGSSLADLYDPLVMPLELVKAHQSVDRAVDKVFGSRGIIETDAERRRILFRSYAKLTSAEMLTE